MSQSSTALPTAQTTSQAEVAATNSVTGLQGFGQSVWLDDLRPMYDATATQLNPRISALLLRIQSEYREMPGLKLTAAQARRLWNLDGDTCNLVLTTLLDQRFLKCIASGTYVRATD